MTKIILKLLGVVAILIFSLVLVIFLLWFNLHWIFNEKNIRRGVELTKIDVSWKKLEIDIFNNGLLGKDIKLLAQDLCLTYPDPKIEACFENAEIAATFRIFRNSPFLRFERINAAIVSSKLKIDIPPSQQPVKSKITWPRLEFGSLHSYLAPYFAYLPTHVMEKIQILLKDIQIFLPQQNLIRGQIAVSKEAEQILLKTQADVITDQKHFLKADVDASLELSPLISLSGKANMYFRDWNLANKLFFSWREFPHIFAHIQVRQKDFKAFMTADLQLRKNVWNLTPQADLYFKKIPVEKILIENCPISLYLQNREPNFLENNCEIELRNLVKRPLKGLPASLRLDSSLRMPIKLTPTIINLTPTWNVGLKRMPFMDFNFHTGFEISVNIEQKKIQKLEIQRLNTTLQVPLFEKIVSLLRKSRWSVPAPLNVLKGSLNLRAFSENADLLTESIPVRFLLTTELRSANQKFISESSFDIAMDLHKPLFTIGGNVRLIEVELQLPYLALENPPQVRPDPRFVKKTVAEKPKPGLLDKIKFSSLKIATQEKPILLRTNLLSDPIPLRIEYVLEIPLQISGKISMEQMNIEFFKKKAVVEKFELTKYKDSKVQDINGRIIYRTSEVIIQILVVGTTEKPRVEFLSDPPLNRQQILSILLFNKSLQQLADEELSSTGQLDQALLTQAFGLASLFLLSSTPIESIYFDPQTQTYTARIRLDDATSFTMGSGFESGPQFRLRRRLGGPWSLSTQLQKGDEATGDVITTLIEWFKRF